MIEYVGKDSKEIKEALSTLILKCTEEKSCELNCTVSYGENLKLDCHFDFIVREEE